MTEKSSNVYNSSSRPQARRTWPRDGERSTSKRELPRHDNFQEQDYFDTEAAGSPSLTWRSGKSSRSKKVTSLELMDLANLKIELLQSTIDTNSIRQSESSAELDLNSLGHIWDQRPTPKRSELEGIKDGLDEKEVTLQSLKVELQRKDADLADMRKRWKQTAKELNRLKMSQKGGLYEVTDRHLVELATRLRYNIRDLAIRHFEGKMRPRDSVHEPRGSRFLHYFGPVVHDTTVQNALLKSGNRRSSVMQAYLWEILTAEIFGRYLWTGSELSGAIQVLNNHMRQERCPIASFDVESCRSFQMWSTQTTSMILHTIDAKKESAVRRFIENTVRDTASGIVDAVASLIIIENDELGLEIERILHEALALDKEIYRQVARVDWITYETPMIFDPEQMEWEGDDEAGRRDQPVRLVVAPALRKRGKSTGEDFDVDRLLLPMIVSRLGPGN
ncbi:hypothetical protein CTAM01_07556 [Colletotrichum tamarilloi]|uniref:Uncharacterized protein n=1 Tax=Colletotrichum tamarilloi TaxID=1209934 RepID=A0ABQ9R891_9PEZI|nr:uncharacterized protein CTAM01_07556 [Colletotrichum tamarilloi]KAK1497919.1 hypothetical protein CTAM01_07556 [Colletotrichum tamarilloi]